MTTVALTDTDVRIRDAVVRSLTWDPRVDATEVGVTARDHAVTLTGFVDTYAAKLAAERAAKRVPGVRAVANDIDVRLKLPRTDADIASDAARALELHTTVPEGVQATVHSGQLTLTGTVPWLYQSRDAEKAVRHIRGLRGIRNHIAVTPQTRERDLRRRITEALHANADFNARHVNVAIDGGRATLTGTVSTWLQRNAVEHAVADAPGVTEVDNCLNVEMRDGEPPDELC
jgi:osmotically-inducible protein OsmY